MVGMRVRATFSDSRTRQTAFTPVAVKNWQRYGAQGVRLGPDDAAVTIVEFSDFTCPPCRAAATDLRDLRRLYPRSVALVYRHLIVHDRGKVAAIASACANRTGAFESMEDILFEQADSIGSKHWSKFAMEAGIRDTARFERCMREASIRNVITRDSIVAGRLGARGTPTLLLNNLRFDGYPGRKPLEAYLVQFLRKSAR
jgi:protein-disulfide isomerase